MTYQQHPNDDQAIRHRIRQILEQQINARGGNLLGGRKRRLAKPKSRLRKQRRAGAMVGGAKRKMAVRHNPWLMHVAQVRHMNPDLSYKEALILAKDSYHRKAGAIVGASRRRVVRKKVPRRRAGAVVGAARRRVVRKKALRAPRRRAGAMQNPWLMHVAQVRRANPQVPAQHIMQLARQSYY